MELSNLKNEQFLNVNIFGKEKNVKIISTGDNSFDATGNYKKVGFELSEREIYCLNWFINNIDISDYKNEILKFCNREYESIGESEITIDEIEEEVNITAIVINITEKFTDKTGKVIYPEISFYGDCNCDFEHGICIGFRDKKFLGIGSQSWTL